MNLSSKKQKLRVLVVGCGNMGGSHAEAYEKHPGFEICGLVSRSSSKDELLNRLQKSYPLFNDYKQHD